VVIPPSTPPDLSALTLDWPGGGLGDVLVKWTSAAPVKKTPLGPHTISIRAKRIGAPSDEAPMIAFDGPLADLGTAQPISGSGAWRVDGTKPAEYHAMVRRADVNDAVAISVRITDPVGRTSESLATIAAGPILPDPVLSDFVLKKSVSPPGAILGWTSGTPLQPPVYTLRVTVNQPPKQLGQIKIPQPPIIQQMALADVPLDEQGPVPPGIDPLRVRRVPHVAKLNYYAFVRVPFTSIVVNLRAPDGRTVEHIQLPS
jgi:hypothetical protein